MPCKKRYDLEGEDVGRTATCSYNRFGVSNRFYCEAASEMMIDLDAEVFAVR